MDVSCADGNIRRGLAGARQLSDKNISEVSEVSRF